MARRCSYCNKFCGVECGGGEDPEASVSDAKAEGATLSLTAELELTSECCSDTVASASVEEEVEVEIQHDADCPVVKGEKDPEYEVEATGFDEDNRYEGSGRWMKTFYGFGGSVSIKCEECGAEASGDARFEEQASGFEDLN